jgi:uncharacterized damage-inducible protein DinB
LQKRRQELIFTYHETATESHRLCLIGWIITTPVSFQQPIYQMLLHVFNHGTYHRGQLINMLRQLGVYKTIIVGLLYSSILS